jgi:hypothetical protein
MMMRVLRTSFLLVSIRSKGVDVEDEEIQVELVNLIRAAEALRQIRFLIRQ